MGPKKVRKFGNPNPFAIQASWIGGSIHKDCVGMILGVQQRLRGFNHTGHTLEISAHL